MHNKKFPIIFLPSSNTARSKHRILAVTNFDGSALFCLEVIPPPPLLAVKTVCHGLLIQTTYSSPCLLSFQIDLKLLKIMRPCCTVHGIGTTRREYQFYLEGARLDSEGAKLNSTRNFNIFSLTVLKENQFGPHPPVLGIYNPSTYPSINHSINPVLNKIKLTIFKWLKMVNNLSLICRVSQYCSRLIHTAGISFIILEFSLPSDGHQTSNVASVQ